MILENVKKYIEENLSLENCAKRIAERMDQILNSEFRIQNSDRFASQNAKGKV